MGRDDRYIKPQLVETDRPLLQALPRGLRLSATIRGEGMGGNAEEPLGAKLTVGTSLEHFCSRAGARLD